MATKKIKDYKQATTANDTDVMILESATETQHVTFLTLVNKIKEKLGIASINSQLTQLNSNKADTNHTHTWATITGKPSTYAPTAHTHDDRYYTEAEINSKMNNMFKVVTVSGASVAFASGESRALTISYTSPSGYVPVGIVGFYTGNVAIRAIRVNAGRIDVINAAAQTVEFTPTITILFCKTGLI